MVELIQLMSPAATSVRLADWERSIIRFAKRGFNVSTFCMSLSDGTPPNAAAGSSSAAAKPAFSRHCRAIPMHSLILVDTAYIRGSIFRFHQTVYYWATDLAQYALITAGFETCRFSKLVRTL